MIECALTLAGVVLPSMLIALPVRRWFERVPWRWVLLPNAAEQYRLEDVRGSDPMEWADYARFFKALEVPDNSIDVKRIVDPGQPLLDLLNVRYLLTEPRASLGGKWRRFYGGLDGELENSAVRPRFWGPAGVTVTTREDRPGRYTLRVASPVRALIESSQPAMRGWRARVNGRRVETVPSGAGTPNPVFLGFYVEPGVSKAIVDYRPASWDLSLARSGLGVAALAFSSRRKWWNRGWGDRVVQRPDTGSVL